MNLSLDKRQWRCTRKLNKQKKQKKIKQTKKNKQNKNKAKQELIIIIFFSFFFLLFFSSFLCFGFLPQNTYYLKSLKKRTEKRGKNFFAIAFIIDRWGIYTLLRIGKCF